MGEISSYPPYKCAHVGEKEEGSMEEREDGIAWRSGGGEDVEMRDGKGG